MRWFLGLLAVVALITGALYLVGQFALSNGLEVTRTVTIERPRASVFAMVNDLGITKEWSPFYARDPDAEFTIDRQAGEGQSMRWRSSVRDVGNGRMFIVKSIENERVESIVELGDRATLNSLIALSEGQSGSDVVWTVSATCADGWINIPCRYMNLIMRGRIARQIDEGLGRLKYFAEQLPEEDFEGLGIVSTRVESLDVIFIDVIITSQSPTFQDREAAERLAIAQLDLFFASNNIERGTTLVRVFPQDNGAGGRFRFSVGYPYTGALPLILPGGIHDGQTPAGTTLQAVVVGPRSLVPAMYTRMRAYMAAHRIGLRPGADAWEVVRPADPADPRTARHAADGPVEQTEIYFPIE